MGRNTKTNKFIKNIVILGDFIILNILFLIAIMCMADVYTTTTLTL